MLGGRMLQKLFGTHASPILKQTLKMILAQIGLLRQRIQIRLLCIMLSNVGQRLFDQLKMVW